MSWRTAPGVQPHLLDPRPPVGVGLLGAQLGDLGLQRGEIVAEDRFAAGDVDRVLAVGDRHQPGPAARRNAAPSASRQRSTEAGRAVRKSV
jgi:hypothetical protein